MPKTTPGNLIVTDSREGGTSRPLAAGNSRLSNSPLRFAGAHWITLSAALLLCASWLGCAGSNPKAATRGGNQAMPVSVATVEKQDLPVFLTGLGTVTAYNTVSVKSRVDGQLVQVAFKEGQHVNKGDLLAEIDPRPFEVQLNQAQAQLYRDQASLRDAQLNYERYKGLLEESGAMSQQQVDTQHATVDQLQGAVRTDQAAIDNAKLQLVYCRITAPVSGRIGLRLVDVGNMVHAADTNPLVVITQLQPIAVIFTLPEDQLPSVMQHMHGGTLQVEAYSRDDQTKIATGKLLTIDNQIDTSTGTGKLKAVFDNKGDELWPNQFVNVHLLLEVRKNATLVPAAAIERGPQGDYTFVVKPDQTVMVQPVTTSITQNSLTQIASGLTPGQQVVTDGQDKLDNGSRVEVRASGHAAQAKQPVQSTEQQ
ncbi:MAG TPA: MdtA/MuxA family multidrug efflux RND transporter periplasmic adaptor subunit [Terriglobales bacterium]|nr:MdtA/MuxA family multidrug efflux RND transporter periplasmic adaptor subunit [Terriglobales bacterium]